MATSSIASSLDSTVSQAETAATPSRFNELTSSDFVKIMLTELSNQDPLKPNDSSALLQQFSSIRNIEADLALQTKLETVVTQGQLSTAGSLLGKYVVGFTDNFADAEGFVNSISQTASGPVLNLSDGSRVSFKNISQIYDPLGGTGNPTTNPTTNPTGNTTGTPPTNPPTTPPVEPSYVPPSTTPLSTNPTHSPSVQN